MQRAAPGWGRFGAEWGEDGQGVGKELREFEGVEGFEVVRF